jgi:hypothetical protein
MVFFCILAGIAVPAGLFAAWEGVSGRRRSPADPKLGSRPPHSNRVLLHARANADYEVVVLPRREIPWISVKECESLMPGNPVFVSVQKTGKRSAPPFPGAPALFAQPGELVRALREIPPDRCVILCGEVDLTAISRIEATDEVVNAHAIYALKRETIRSEVA